MPTWVLIAIAAWLLFVLIVVSVLRAAALADRRTEREYRECLDARGAAAEADEPPPASPTPLRRRHFSRVRHIRLDHPPTESQRRR